MSRLKPVFKCTHENDKEKFKRSKCLLTISVGQEVHEAQHFESTVQLVNDSFDSCIMLIDDSLQRHSMALGYKQSADDFHQQSIIAGDQWLQRNAVYYEKLTILEKIVRWDHWLQHPSFAMQQNRLKKFMASNAPYKNVGYQLKAGQHIILPIMISKGYLWLRLILKHCCPGLSWYPKKASFCGNFEDSRSINSLKIY